MKDDIKSELLIIGFDCPPEEITTAIGLSPTKVVKKGDVKHGDSSMVGPVSRHNDNVWILQSDISNTAPLEEHIELMLKKMKPHSEAIAALAERYSGELSIYGFAHDATRQALHIERRYIHELEQLGIDLDIDIYPTVE